jgi:hypothetical protein
MAIQQGTGDRGVVVTVRGGSVVVGTTVVSGTVTVVVVGGRPILSIILKEVEMVTSWVIPETFTIYSSGLNAVVSIS